MDEEANLFRKNMSDLIGEEVNALVGEGNYVVLWFAMIRKENTVNVL